MFTLIEKITGQPPPNVEGKGKGKGRYCIKEYLRDTFEVESLIVTEESGFNHSFHKAEIQSNEPTLKAEDVNYPDKLNVHALEFIMSSTTSNPE